MAIALINNLAVQVGTGNGGTSSSIDTTGATLIVIVTGYINGPLTVSDSKGNTWIARTENVNSLRKARIYYTVPTSVGTGHTFTVTATAAYPSCSVLVFSGTDSTPYDKEAETDFSGTSVTLTSTTPTNDNSLVIAGWGSNGTPTSVSVNGGFTIGHSLASGANNAPAASAYLIQTTKAAAAPQFSWTGSATGAAVLAVFKAVTGPAITTQPTAQTARLNGDATTAATFTVAATGTGGLTYDWELETSVGGGVYANLADGNGATWTGQTAASCVGTFSAKTLSGRRVRCNVTDDNGTTTTDAVTLTVLDGPVLSASSATTNGSGQVAPTMTSDDALSANGEILLVTMRDTRGNVIARTTVRPA